MGCPLRLHQSHQLSRAKLAPHSGIGMWLSEEDDGKLQKIKKNQGNNKNIIYVSVDLKIVETCMFRT